MGKKEHIIMSYTTRTIDGLRIDTQKFEMGYRTEKSRIKKYIGIFVFLLIGIAVSNIAASHQANGSVSVYQNYLQSNGR